MCLAAALAFAQDAAPSPERIAFRYDDSHVIVVLEQTGGDLRDNPADQLTPLPPPRTRNAGLEEVGTSDELMNRFADLFRGVATGQVWAIEADAQHLFAGTIEKLAFGSADCATAIDALAIVRLSPEQQVDFQKFPGDYFLAVNSTSGKVPAVSAIGLLPGEVKLSGAQEKQLRASLNGSLQAHLKKVRGESGKPEQSDNDATARERWTDSDARLSRGEGKLTWTIQRLKAGPNGEERLYVRATWSLGDYAAYLMTAWVIPQGLKLEVTEPKPAAWIRAGELKKQSPDEALMGTILGVYAGENGWARVLVGAAEGEGYEMEVIQLSPAGPKRTDLAYGYGC